MQCIHINGDSRAEANFGQRLFDAARSIEAADARRREAISAAPQPTPRLSRLHGTTGRGRAAFCGQV